MDLQKQLTWTHIFEHDADTSYPHGCPATIHTLYTHGHFVVAISCTLTMHMRNLVLLLSDSSFLRT